MSDAQTNIDKFESWHKDKSLAELSEFVNFKTKELVKTLVTRDSGIGYSALKPVNGNPVLLQVYKEFEKKLIGDLIKAGLLQSVEASNKSNTQDCSSVFNTSGESVNEISRRNAELEKENFSLRAEIKALKGRLGEAEASAERHRETIQVINEINGVL